MNKNAVFLIEGGKPLEMVKEHIADLLRIRKVNSALADELGITQGYVCNHSGVLLGARFKGQPHPDFKKPKRNGVSFPKKGTEWARRLAEQKGHHELPSWIAEELGIPLTISFQVGDGDGWQHIGSLLYECGFLFLSAEGPYAMWTPDVPVEVAKIESEGKTVSEPAKSFRLEFEGCRRIEIEEWNIMVQQKRLEDKRQQLIPNGDQP